MPTVKPPKIIDLLFKEPAIIGTKAGEQINAVEVMIKVSASTLKTLARSVWMIKDTVIT